MSRISDLGGFMRLRVCIFIVFAAIAGYFTFNDFGIPALLVALCSFFAVAGGYALNNMKDSQEDAINKGRVYSYGPAGYALVALFSAIAFAFSAFLSLNAVVLTAILVASGIVYSYFRMKRFTVVKNVYTGISLSLVFLMGTAALQFSAYMLIYYVPIAMFFTAGSIVSDIRDIKGDASSGIRTLPLVLGRSAAKKVVYCIMTLSSISLLTLNLTGIYVLLPFAFLTVFAVRRDKISLAHNCGGLSFIALALWSTIRGGVIACAL